LYRRLLAIRHAEIVPHLAEARALGAVAIGDAAVVARWQLAGDRVLTIAINLGDAAVTFPQAGDLLFSEGKVGAAASAAVWLDTP
jgi:maltooligosyltrehalose trehalohydrolase